MKEMNPNLLRLKPSGIRRYAALAKQLPGCVDLTLGEPDFPTPQPIRMAAAAALEAGMTHYAPNQGLEALRRRIAQVETARGMACTAQQVLITVGATGALFTALMGILSPGDEVVIPTPAFPLYESLVLLAGAVPVPLDTSRDGFQLTSEGLARAVAGRTRAIVLNSPNNPAGTVYTAQSLANVRAAVEGKPIYLVCDNVYSALCDGVCPDLSVEEALREQVLLCQSFSKPYAMTGWRVGYLVAPPALMERLVLLHAAMAASVPTFVQQACLTALETDIAPMAQQYRLRRQCLSRGLREMGLACAEPSGAFYAFAPIARFGVPDEVFCTRMAQEAGVAVVPGTCFGTAGFARVSCSCDWETLHEGLTRMERFVKKLELHGASGGTAGGACRPEDGRGGCAFCGKEILR